MLDIVGPGSSVGTVNPRGSFGETVLGRCKSRPLFLPPFHVRTSVYIDGFNLYFGALRRTPHKWLDVATMARMNLAAHHRIAAIKYFTARIDSRPNNPDQPVRQETYFRALRTLPNLEIILGHYLTKVVRMPLANPPPGHPPVVEVVKTEEKGSDVNLATHLVHDAHCGRFECAVVISGDSDLLAPVRTVIEELHLPVGVLNPQRHPCTMLKRYATFYKHLRPNFNAASQFPPMLTDAQGTFTKPAGW